MKDREVCDSICILLSLLKSDQYVQEIISETDLYKDNARRGIAFLTEAKLITERKDPDHKSFPVFRS